MAGKTSAAKRVAAKAAKSRKAVVLIIAPGARVFAVLWLIGSVALVAGILMIALGSGSRA